MEPSQTLLEMLHGSWKAQALHVAAELRLADLLASGPRTSDDLAAATQTHAHSLHRLLRALTTIDICREREDGSFEITETGSLLASDVPGSLRHWTIWWANYLWPVWGNLLYSVKTGKSARALLTGVAGFGHLERDAAAADIFNKALAELTSLTAQSIVAAYDFGRFKRVIDVGGGHGQLLAAILRANSTMTGMLFDLPHAMEGAKRYMEAAGLTGRCEFFAGDFFESIPAGADAYVLKSVIHDWNQEDGVRILQNCRRSMSPGARLLLVERIVPRHLDASPEHQSLVRTDLSMLAALAAEERTEAQFRDLLGSAGFEIARIVPAAMTVSVIEGFSAH